MVKPISRLKNPNWWDATMFFSEQALLLKGLIWDNMYKETAPQKQPCGERFCNRKFILVLKTVVE